MAEQCLNAIDDTRSYTITHNLGQEWVKQRIASHRHQSRAQRC